MREIEQYLNEHVMCVRLVRAGVETLLRFVLAQREVCPLPYLYNMD